MARRVGTLAPLSLALLLSAGCHASMRTTRDAPTAADPLRVMTFNLRYDTPRDSANGWPYRKDWVASLIRFHGADVVGIQEGLLRQLVDLDARLPGWARVGVGRTDGREAGEFSAILYRTDRLEALESGTFWLSPTPEVTGSKGWDAALERIATWARFRDRRTGCRLLHLNTHFDHLGEQARQESARLIRRRLPTLAAGLPVIVTGDFNTTPSSVAYRIFTRDTIPDAIAPLADAYVVSRTGHYGPASSWNGFKAIDPGHIIDYVLVSPGTEVLSHGSLTDSWDGRFPSDHLPVLAAVVPSCR
jgi:endonuclease/exonuclease/phosphatase family metal-dependent hydrolase